MKSFQSYTSGNCNHSKNIGAVGKNNLSSHLWENRKSTEQNPLVVLYKEIFQNKIHFCSLNRIFSFIFLLIFLFSALSIYPAFADPIENARKYTEEGSDFMTKGLYKDALNSYSKAMEIYQELQHADGITASCVNMGNALRRLGDYKLAVQYYSRASLLIEKSGDKKTLAILLGNIGNVYLDQRNYQEAVKYYRKSVEIAREIKEPNIEGINLGNIGSIYLNLQDYKTALEFYAEAIDILKKAGNEGTVGTYLGHVAIIYSEMGELKQALIYYQQALEIACRNKNYPNISLLSAKLSKAYLETGDLTNALKYCNEAVEVARAIDHKLYLSSFLGELALINARMGNKAKSNEFIEKGMAVAREMKDPRTEADLWSDYGLCCEQFGEMETALKSYNQAYEIYNKLADEERLEFIYVKAADLHRKMGNFSDAIKFYTKAVLQDKRIGNPTRAGMNLGSMGLVYLDMGEYEKAIAYLRETENLSSQAGNTRAALAAKLNIAFTYAALGNYSKAFGAFDSVLAAAIEMGNKDLESSANSNMGLLNYKLGNYPKALTYFIKSLKLSEETGDLNAEGNALKNVGSSYFALGNYQKAIEYYDRAYELADKIGDSKTKVSCWMNLAAIFVNTGKFGKAIELNEKVIKAYKEKGAMADLNLALLNTGVAYMKQALKNNNEEDLKKAKAYMEEALIITGKTGDLNMRAQVFGNLGIVFENMNERKKAIENLKNAIEIVEGFRSDIKIEEMQASLSGKYSIFYDLLIDLLIKEGNSSDALEYAERAKARSFLDSLGNRQILPRDENTKKLVEDSSKLSALMRSLNSSLPELSEKDTVDIQIKLRETRKALGEIREKIQRISPEYASMVSVFPSTLKDIQNSLSPDEVLVEYYLGRFTAYAWVISTDGISCVTISENGEEINKMITSLREMIKSETGKSNEQSDQDRKNVVLSNAYSILFKPLEDKLKGKTHLVIVPHGKLHYLPFAALVDGEGKYLVEKYSFLMEPSASSMVLLRKRSNKRDVSLLGFALGNADISKNKPTDSNAPQVEAVPSEFRGGFSPLPGSKEELAEIEKTMKEKNIKTKIYIEDKFTVDTVEKLVNSAGIIHFATHGFLSGNDRGQFSGLVTANGFIYVMDIYNWRLDSDLVVLSACETGMGKLTGGDEVVGLSRAFMQSGADNLLSTLWSVEDKTTRDLMTEFYKNMLSGQTKTDSLRNAQIKLMKENSDPGLWSPFVLSGKGK